MIPLDHDLISLFKHDLFGKPASIFPDHTLERLHAREPKGATSGLTYLLLGAPSRRFRGADVADPNSTCPPGSARTQWRRIPSNRHSFSSRPPPCEPPRSL